MLAHCFDQLLPELLTALLVNAFISDDGELLRAGNDKNQDGVSLLRLLHPELEKFLLGKWQGIARQFAALNEDANLAGSLRLRCGDRVDDAIVLEPGQEFFRSHD